MVARPTEPSPSIPPGRRVSILESLSGYRRALAVVPTVVVVALAIALFVGALPVDGFVVGAVLAGPVVVTLILAVDRLRHR